MATMTWYCGDNYCTKGSEPCPGHTEDVDEELVWKAPAIAALAGDLLGRHVLRLRLRGRTEAEILEDPLVKKASSLLAGQKRNVKFIICLGKN